MKTNYTAHNVQFSTVAFLLGSYATLNYCMYNTSVLSIDLRISETSIEIVTIAHDNQELMGWSFNPHNLAMIPPTHEYAYSW